MLKFSRLLCWLSLLLQVALAEEVTGVFWNLQNFFLKQPVAPNGEKLKPVKLKSEKEIDDIIQVIKTLNPDVLGLCELGRQGELELLQKRLKKAGLDYPYIKGETGSDLYRSLGFLSKYKIKRAFKIEKSTFRTEKNFQSIRRGVLSVEVDSPLGALTFVGAHLKSKRPMRHDDEKKVRYGEAMRLREHVVKLISHKNVKKLVLYGDFNDTRSSAVIRMLGGKSGYPTRLTKLPLKGKDYTYWTHHWKSEDIYSRFDYVFLSPALKKSWVPERSFIADKTKWYRCSDHRPLVVVFK